MQNILVFNIVSSSLNLYILVLNVRYIINNLT